MPAERVHRGRTYPTYAIVGTHLTPGAIVRHVGLLQAESPGAEKMAVHDQQPPANLPPLTASIPADVIGYLPLDTDELEAIAVELKSLRTQLQHSDVGGLHSYRARPSASAQTSENGTVLYYQFSCVGLVQHCYQRAIGTPLVDERCLPQSTLSDLVAVWPQAAISRLRPHLGLPDPGPWDVLLPGHVFHAVAEAGARPFRLPFQASNEHAAFPLLPDLAWQRALDEGWPARDDEV